MQYASKAQISKIHVLLAKIGEQANKAAIVSQFTHGRTKSTKEMYMNEARKLIKNLDYLATTKDMCDTLSAYTPRDRKRLAIIMLARKAGIIYGTSEADDKINVAKLNLFCRVRGAVKKDLADMTMPELNKTHRQFEAIAKSVEQANDKKQADKAVKNLLDELNILIHAR